MRKFSSLLWAFVFASGLLLDATEATGAQSAKTRPAPDLSTPERALNSYWALREWSSVQERSPAQSEEMVAYIDSMTQVTLGETRRFFQTLDAHREADLQRRLERTITSTTQESPSRVVIVANVKNVTPIPANAKPTPYQVQLREKGENFKYVMALDGDRWKVLEVWWVRDFGTTPLYEVSLPEYPAYVPPQ